MMERSVIETSGLSKSYGGVHAVRELNLSVPANSITAFLGLNGAGKSTTVKMLLGMIDPSAGEGYVLGHRIDDPAENITLHQRIAYVSENKRLYDYMTVEQMLRFTRPFYQGWRSDVERELLELYELPLNRKIKKLSKGMRTKLALLLAFARRSELLILDEPSDGLDPVGIEQLLQSLVTGCNEGTSIFFSSHQIPEVERIADHVCMLDKGRLVLDASMDDLRQSYRQIDLVFPSVPDEQEFRLAGVESIQTKGHQMRVFASQNLEMVMERARSFYPTSIEVSPVGLRDIFLRSLKES